jgi:hypothetical protein
MLKTMMAAALAAGLLTAPFAASNAAAQTQAGTPTKPKPVKKAKSTKPPTPGQKAAHARQKQCGAEWKAAKAAGKIEKGMKWPQYWSACNKRLKAGGERQREPLRPSG